MNNLSRLANKTGCTFVSEKLGDKKYQVKMAVKTEQTGGTLEEEEFVCEAPYKKVTVAVISSNVMGNGDDELDVYKRQHKKALRAGSHCDGEELCR